MADNGIYEASDDNVYTPSDDDIYDADSDVEGPLDLEPVPTGTYITSDDDIFDADSDVEGPLDMKPVPSGIAAPPSTPNPEPADDVDINGGEAQDEAEPAPDPALDPAPDLPEDVKMALRVLDAQGRRRPAPDFDHYEFFQCPVAYSLLWSAFILVTYGLVANELLAARYPFQGTVAKISAGLGLCASAGLAVYWLYCKRQVYADVSPYVHVYYKFHNGWPEHAGPLAFFAQPVHRAFLGHTVYAIVVRIALRLVYKFYYKCLPSRHLSLVSNVFLSLMAFEGWSMYCEMLSEHSFGVDVRFMLPGHERILYDRVLVIRF